ncbi:MAG: hypothetical protein CME64_04175 [Halobacteriovoraceae bacterium]|nr:hypothetical protein [Halobacteriovoraceae bacterium]|tara:strand:- start:114333 stop:114920 length:588 start_codon:yes stop_codon:yes gene_type:complete
MKDSLTVVPRLKNMGHKEIVEKYQAGLIPVVFRVEGGKDLFGFLLSRELYQQNLMTGLIFDVEYNGEVFHAQLRNIEPKSSDGTRWKEFQFDILKDSDFSEKRVPIITSGTALGEMKGAHVYQARNIVVLRGLRSQMPDYIKVDITNLDVNQKFFTDDLKLSQGVGLASKQEGRLILECKYKYRDVSLIDAFYAV